MGEGSYIYSSATRATERGYTQKMARNITGTESSIRNYADEELHVFNAKGDHVKRIGGKGASVDLRGHTIPKDSIITHNHPRALGKSGIKAIGNSFSVNDIAIAVKNDAKEIRAVTPTYTFSLKRPKGGWGVSVDDLVTQYKSVKSERAKSDTDYLFKRDFSQTALDRANTALYHSIWQTLAKKNGWNYTKTRG